SGSITSGGVKMSKKVDRSSHTAIDASTNVNSQTGAKAVGKGAKAANRGSLTQQVLDSQTGQQVAALLEELVVLLRELEVPKATKPKLDETVSAAEEAKDEAKSAKPDKGRLQATWEKVKGWVNGALSVGMFVEGAAEKAKSLIEKLG